MSYMIFYIMLYRYYILYKYKQNIYLLLLLVCKSQVNTYITVHVVFLFVD